MSTGHTNRLQNSLSHEDGATDWQHQFEEYQDAVMDSVRENPIAATMIVFGVGLGIGTIIGSLLVDPQEHRRRRLANSLGRRMLNSISDYIPEGLQQHLPH